jgi:hypothetical protein
VNSLLQRGIQRREPSSNGKRPFCRLAPLAFAVGKQGCATEVPQEQQANQGPHGPDSTPIAGEGTCPTS